MQKDESHKLCLKFIDQELWNKKEGWQFSDFQGKYLLQVLAFMQALWLRKTRATYMSKKLLLFLVSMKQNHQFN
jgi:hypothetical protein